MINPKQKAIEVFEDYLLRNPIANKKGYYHSKYVLIALDIAIQETSIHYEEKILKIIDEFWKKNRILK